MSAASLSAPPVIAFGALLCKETWPTLWLMTAQSVSRLHPHHRQAQTSLVAGRASLRLTTAAVCGSRDCALRLQTLFDGYISALSRHRNLWRCRALSLRCQPATSACISGSSTALRRAPFLLSPLSHTDGHVLPPTVAMPPTSQAPGTATLIIRLRRNARPRPRCTVRRCTDSVPAVGQPLHSLRVCLRLRARAGRLTVCGASSSTESLSLRTSATPAICSNPDVGTPSSLRSFG